MSNLGGVGQDRTKILEKQDNVGRGWSELEPSKANIDLLDFAKYAC